MRLIPEITITLEMFDEWKYLGREIATKKNLDTDIMKPSDFVCLFIATRLGLTGAIKLITDYFGIVNKMKLAVVSK